MLFKLPPLVYDMEQRSDSVLRKENGLCALAEAADALDDLGRMRYDGVVVEIAAARRGHGYRVRIIAAVFGFIHAVVAPDILPGVATGVGHAADLEPGFKPAAAEQEQARGVEPAADGQIAHCAPEHARLQRLVQQTPDDDAGMVAVALDHIACAVVKALQHGFLVPDGVFAHAQLPGGEAFGVDEQADLVAQVELLRPEHAGDIANAVEAVCFGKHEILTRLLYKSRYHLADGEGVAGMGAFEEDAATVEVEEPVPDEKFTEPVPHRFAMDTRVRLHRNVDAVEMRVVYIPQHGVVNRQFGLIFVAAPDKVGPELPGRDAFAVPAAHVRARRVFQRQVDAHASGMYIALHEHVCNMHIRNDVHIYGVSQAAYVVAVAGPGLHAFIAVGDVCYVESVNIVVGWVEHAHGDEVFPLQRGDIRHVKSEGRFAALKAA